jgi:hypothetical protein
MSVVELPRALVVLDTDRCGLDAFERFLDVESPEELEIRVIVRAASDAADDMDAADRLLHDATILAQQQRFTSAGWMVIHDARALDAELADTLGFDEAVIIMPESGWPTSQSSRLRRSARRYGALVRFDCLATTKHDAPPSNHET